MAFVKAVFELINGERRYITTGTIVFDEGQKGGSKIFYTGFYPLVDWFTTDASDFAIIGGVGDFGGVSVSQKILIFFFQTTDKSFGTITIHCL